MFIVYKTKLVFLPYLRTDLYPCPVPVLLSKERYEYKYIHL